MREANRTMENWKVWAQGKVSQFLWRQLESPRLGNGITRIYVIYPRERRYRRSCQKKIIPLSFALPDIGQPKPSITIINRLFTDKISQRNSAMSNSFRVVGIWKMFIFNCFYCFAKHIQKIGMPYKTWICWSLASFVANTKSI